MPDFPGEQRERIAIRAHVKFAASVLVVLLVVSLVAALLSVGALESYTEANTMGASVTGKMGDLRVLANSSGGLAEKNPEYPEIISTAEAEEGRMHAAHRVVRKNLQNTSLESPRAKLSKYCSPHLMDIGNTPPPRRSTLSSSPAIKPDESVTVKRELAGSCPKLRKRIISLPQHCIVPLRGEIVIKGERHSGTNWIRNIISQNTCNKCERDPQFGWKHGFLPPRGCGKPLSGNDVLLVVTRDAFTWLAKMYERPYTPYLMEMRNKGFSSFIRARYKYESSQSGMELCKKYNDEGTPSAESAENIVQIRTEKYKQWLSKNRKERNRYHLQLEALYAGNASATDVQSKFIGDPLNARCVPILSGKKDFRAIAEYTNWDAKKKIRGFDPVFERQALLQYFSKEDLCFVISQLDLAFEEEIPGYSYGYVYDLLQ